MIDHYDRLGLSSKLEADTFISIHVNSALGTSTPNGIETYYFDIEKADKNYLDPKKLILL